MVCADFLLNRKLRSYKAKKIICPSVARCMCSEMDESKTVAALRRSRFLVKKFLLNFFKKYVKIKIAKLIKYNKTSIIFKRNSVSLGLHLHNEFDKSANFTM